MTFPYLFVSESESCGGNICSRYESVECRVEHVTTMACMTSRVRELEGELASAEQKRVAASVEAAEQLRSAKQAATAALQASAVQLKLRQAEKEICQNSKLMSELDILHGQMQHAAEKAQKLVQTQAATEQRRDQLEIEVATVKDQLKAAHDELAREQEASKRNVTALEQAVQQQVQQAAELQKAETELVATQQKLKGASRDRERLVSQLASANAEIESLRKEGATSADQHSADSAIAAEKIQALGDDVESLRAALAQSRSDAEATAAALAEVMASTRAAQPTQSLEAQVGEVQRSAGESHASLAATSDPCLHADKCHGRRIRFA